MNIHQVSSIESNMNEYYTAVFVSMTTFFAVFLVIQFYIDKHIHDENWLVIATNVALVVAACISLLVVIVFM